MVLLCNKNCSNGIAKAALEVLHGSHGACGENVHSDAAMQHGHTKPLIGQLTGKLVFSCILKAKLRENTCYSKMAVNTLFFCLHVN